MVDCVTFSLNSIVYSIINQNNIKNNLKFLNYLNLIAKHFFAPTRLLVKVILLLRERAAPGGAE